MFRSNSEKSLLAYRVTTLFITLVMIFGIACRSNGNRVQAKVVDNSVKASVANTDDNTSDSGAVTLSAIVVRGDGSISEIVLQPGTGVAKLRLTVDNPSQYQSYQADIVNAEGKTIWSITSLKVKVTGSSGTVLLKIPANLLTGSDYYAKLSGINSNGIDEIANYPFAVKVSANSTSAQNDPINPLTSTPPAGTGIFGSGGTDDEGVVGLGNGTGAGVKGIGSSNTGSPGVVGSGGTNGGIGVQAFGTSGSTVVRGFGVYAVGASSNTDGDVAGVYGTSTSKGVVGYGNNSTTGVADYNHGIYGYSGKGSHSAGIFGESRRISDSAWQGYGVYGKGSVAIFGQGQGPDPYGGNGVGVQGTGSRGVQGEGYGAGSIGVVGVVGNDTNAVGVFGAAGSGALAGRFEGNVNVNGNLNITGSLTGTNLPTGPAGPTGATGATGPQGAAGATGATGPQGPAGAGLPTISTTTISYNTNGAFTVSNSSTNGGGIIGNGGNGGDGVTGIGGHGGYGIKGTGGTGGQIGILGQGTSSFAGVKGIGGPVNSPGVEGQAKGNGSGVVGTADPNGSDGIGVLGYDGGNSANLAGKFIGNVQVTGNIAGGSKTFKIDHPLDPENKYLYHVSVESPDMMNIYNGNITTNSNGDAVVTMPSYFDALNTDCRYQLTVIGQFAQAIVSNKINNNQFTIKTDKPNVEVSWQVTGVRKDPYAEKHRVQVEVDKAPQERGLYVNPDVYNQPADKAINSKSAKSQYLPKQ